MNKRELMEECWIPIHKRIPSDSDYEFVAVYNSQNGYMFCFQSSWAHTYAKLCLEGRGEELSWDRRFTHWMPLYKPQKGISWAEYNAQNSRNKK